MGDFYNKESKTVCSQSEMVMAFVDLASIVGTLQDAYEKASELLGSFTADYEGEAADEVEIFLENLPVHIKRLMLLYYKMEQFILVTAQSFQTNDARMVQNMEN